MLTHSPSAHQHSPSLGGCALPLARGRSRISDALGESVRERLSVQDKTAERLERDLARVAQVLGERVAAMLKGEPEGDTPVELSFAGLNDADRIQAAIDATDFLALAELADDAGVDAAALQWFGSYNALAESVEASLGVIGVEQSNLIFDSEGARLSLNARINRDDNALFDHSISNRWGVAALDVIAGGGLSADDIGARVTLSAEESLPGIGTEARTRIAEADRAIMDMAIEEADPSGDLILYAYAGPNDAKTRPFCGTLINKAFTREQISGLSNGQTASPPSVSGGGFNCRHLWVPTTADLIADDDVPYSRGTQADITAANVRSRKKGKK